MTTKLYIPPPRPDLVSRPHLIERLNAGLGRKLTLVSAPAGFGKTTLLSEWIHRRSEVSVSTNHSREATASGERTGAGTSPLKAVWVSLDEGDNDPVRFLAYLVAALQPIQASIGETAMAAVQSPQPPPVEAVLTALVNDIAEAPQPFILVLDDYHTINARSIHDALSFLLDHLPPRMHLVIATRAVPPLPIPRLRGRGWLNELYQSDLRFNSQEIAQFLDLVLGLKLPAEDIISLERRTEGWIAGLQMAAHSMRGRDDIAAFVRAFTGSHRYILDYLSDEVLQRQSRDVQAFLLQTSILDRLSGKLCDAVIGATESAESQSVLEYLERSNLFVVPLDDERLWYRYHHLFADFLQHRLRVTQPAAIPELYLRASVWFAAQGQMGEAVQYALAAEDFERAGGLVELSAHATFARGEVKTLLGWLEALPDELVRARPRLGLAHAKALLTDGQYEAAESRLQDVETSCQAQASSDEDPELNALLGDATTTRAIIARFQEDFPRAIELSRQALKHLPDRKENFDLRGLIAMNLGWVYLYSSDVVAAGRSFNQAWTISQRSGHALTSMMSLYGLTQLEMMQGHLHQAVETCQQALQFAAERAMQHGRRLPVAGTAYIGMGTLLYEWNDLDGATRYLLEGIELAKLLGYPIPLTKGYLALVRLKQAQGDMAGASDAFQQAEQFARKSKTNRALALVVGCQARLWLSPERGNLAAAARWVREYRMEDELSYLRQAEYLALARVRIALGQADEALELLARLQGAAEAAGRLGEVIEMLLLKALAFQTQGDRVLAMTALERALSLAEPEGYIRTLVDEGAPMKALLSQAATRAIAPEYVRKLLAALGVLDGESMGATTPHPQTHFISEPLSERELEVLRLIAAGLSNREIAQELTLATGTVKKHTNNIFGKLNVHSRTQAVAQARELSLL